MGACESKLHLGEMELNITTHPAKVATLLVNRHLYDRETKNRIKYLARDQFVQAMLPHEQAHPPTPERTLSEVVDESLPLERPVLTRQTAEIVGGTH